MIEKSQFGVLEDGRPVTKYRITNGFGEYAEMLDYGACLYSLCIRNRDGELTDVVLGVPNVEELVKGGMSGITVGRCANRIAYGRFQLNGKTVHLECNMFGHHLHGASGGYGTKLFWELPETSDKEVCFGYTDHGEGGYGNTVEVQVRFSFNDLHQLQISYWMKGEEDTLLCPTNHAYFNLNGASDIRDQTLWLNAQKYAVKGSTGMPEGETAAVEGTPLDFRTAHAIGDALQERNQYFFERNPPELDDTFLLNKDSRSFGLAAQLCSWESGIAMKVYTDMPALIAFTMYVHKPRAGKRNERYQGYCSIALETQYVPNAVNCDTFDVPLFCAQEPLCSKTVYEFNLLPP